MFCFLVFGHRYMGACDYFTFNGGEFYVNARMYHIQFCPVSVEQAVLKFPSVPDRGLTITQVNGIGLRCFLWAALRSYTLVVSLALLLISLLLLRTGSNVYAVLVVSILGLLLSAWAWAYKPKASEERKDVYVRMMTPRSASRSVMQVPVADERIPTGSKAAHVIDVLRPQNQYHSLKEMNPENGTK